MKNIDLDITYTEPQQELFFSSNSRVKLIPKGRRFGFTRGVINYVIDYCFDGNKKVLWIDTTNPNIDRYVNRYAMPVLKPLGSQLYQWRQQRKELEILSSIVDFRSYDKPENIEGFGYDLIVINEAGIVLSNEYLWYNTITPMTLDYHAAMIIGGTPKGKRSKKTKSTSGAKINKEHLFFELCKKCHNFNSLAEKLGTSTINLSDTKKDWELFHFTSYDNPLLDPADVKELELDTPYAVRGQEIFGKFIDDVSVGIIKPLWWNRFTEMPAFEIMKIDSWDTAQKTNEENDYTVRTSWILSRLGMFLYEREKERYSYPELKKRIYESYIKNKPDVILIEDKSSGISVIQDLQQMSLPIIAIKKDKDKIAYAHAASPSFEAGNVYILDKQSWAEDTIEMCGDFPNGLEDDTVDSITQAVNYMKNQISSGQMEIVTHRATSLTDNY